MELGDHVVFAKNPLMYGVMRVGVKTADGRLVCEPCHPLTPARLRRPEVFFNHEVAAFTDPLVDFHAEAAKLEEKDTQRAQDKDADAKGGGDTGEGKGSE